MKQWLRCVSYYIIIVIFIRIISLIVIAFVAIVIISCIIHIIVLSFTIIIIIVIITIAIIAYIVIINTNQSCSYLYKIPILNWYSSLGLRYNHVISMIFLQSVSMATWCACHRYRGSHDLWLVGHRLVAKWPIKPLYPWSRTGFLFSAHIKG